MTNIIAQTIDSALNDVAKNEVTIRRAEESLAADIANDILAIISERDFVTELDKVKAAACGLALAQALVDGVGSWFGKADKPVPRHVVADFFAIPANVKGLRDVGLQKYRQTVEADVMKRVRLRSDRSKVEHYAEGRPERNAEVAPLPMEPVFTGDPSHKKYPAKKGKL
jgi:hypothetical protein